MAARELTSNLVNTRRRWVPTVHSLMSRTDAIMRFVHPCATIRTISCSRGLSDTPEGSGGLSTVTT